MTPNTPHNHVPYNLPPAIPKSDLVLAILSSSSSSVSVIVKPGPRYLHVSSVCQLQQPTNLTHTPRQAINQSINQPCSELPARQCSNPRYTKPSCRTIRMHSLQVIKRRSLLEFDFDEMPTHAAIYIVYRRYICHAEPNRTEPCPTRNASNQLAS